jgi:hypothetical protein
MLTLKYIYIYAFLVFYSCFTSLDICNCCNPPLLTYIHLYSFNTRTLLVRFLVCEFVYVCRLTGLAECVEQSEGLRRDGAWEHGVLQQRAAGEAALHEPPHVCLLMHVGAAQARTRGRPVRLVSPAVQVRVGCRRRGPLTRSYLYHTHTHTYTYTHTHTHICIYQLYSSIDLSIYRSIFLYMLYSFLLYSCVIYNICVICL